MKKIWILASALFISVVSFSQVKLEETVKMNVEKYDFGKIKQGEPVTYSFEITNTGSKPLVVENSWASCGCTTPEKITEPIMPGASAKLKVQYNAAAVAPFTKDVYVKFAGIDQTKTVQITGEVVSAEAFEAQKGATPATPATRATPGSKGSPATPATPATPASKAAGKKAADKKQNK
jgi:hypothetical protein